jgi:hypothetical protein
MTEFRDGLVDVLLISLGELPHRTAPDRKPQALEFAIAGDRHRPRLEIATCVPSTDELVSLPSWSKYRVPVTFLPWSVGVT